MRRTPKNPKKAAKICLTPKFSPKNNQLIKTTNIGEINISDIASPNGNIVIPIY